VSVIDKIHMLKKILSEAERIVSWQEDIYTALHNIHASWITSGRLGMPRMPDGASGYVLTAQGAGADPAYVAATGVPSGLIAMWHGLIADIPSGWVICDGNNGTPNLLGRFVEGVADASTNPGATGGSTGKTTSTASATILCGTAALSATGAHSHSIGDIRPLFYDIAFIMKT
jgi:hypothetical protein